jgi:hypothetical protein
MAQISLSFNGTFWPTSLPLFHGSGWARPTVSSMVSSSSQRELDSALPTIASMIANDPFQSFDYSFLELAVWAIVWRAIYRRVDDKRLHYPNSSSKALASFKSSVSKPSVNQP